MKKQSCAKTWKIILGFIVISLVFSMILFSLGYSVNDNWCNNDFEYRK